MEFGERLKLLRQGKGMTQKDLAERINISPQAISRWENSEVEPSIETLRTLAEIFDVTMDDLFGKESKSEPAQGEPAPQEPPVTLNVTANFNEQRPVLAVCEICNTPLYNKEDVVRLTVSKGRTTCKEVRCLKCHTKAKLSSAKGKVADELSTKKRALWISGVVASVVLVIGLIVSFSSGSEGVAGRIGISVLIAALSYMAPFCMVVGESFIGDMGAEVASWSFHAPGIIFEWSADGIIDLFLMKALFWFIGLIVGILAFCLATALVLVCSPFAFPYDVYALRRNIRQSKEEEEKYLKKWNEVSAK